MSDSNRELILQKGAGPSAKPSNVFRSSLGVHYQLVLILKRSLSYMLEATSFGEGCMTGTLAKDIVMWAMRSKSFKEGSVGDNEPKGIKKEMCTMVG